MTGFYDLSKKRGILCHLLSGRGGTSTPPERAYHHPLLSQADSADTVDAKHVRSKHTRRYSQHYFWRCFLPSGFSCWE